jgi:hypothetical protein
MVPRYQWLTYLINTAGSCGALDAVMSARRNVHAVAGLRAQSADASHPPRDAQAVETQDTLTLRTLEAAMKFLSKVRGRCVQPCVRVIPPPSDPLPAHGRWAPG